MVGCHENGPPGPLKYWCCKWDEKHLGIERDFELQGKALSRLLRIRPDCNDQPGWFPDTRTDFMTIACREALRDRNCEIVGGFIRDWIIIGEEPNDIALRIWNSFNMSDFISRCITKWNLRRYDRGQKLGFITPWGDWFSIDYIYVENIKEGNKNTEMDLDVNSFAISTDLGLHKRDHLERPICKIYGNIKKKEAYLFRYNPCCEHCGYVTERVGKMQKRGWTVYRAHKVRLL